MTQKQFQGKLTLTSNIFIAFQIAINKGTNHKNKADTPNSKNYRQKFILLIENLYKLNIWYHSQFNHISKSTILH